MMTRSAFPTMLGFVLLLVAGPACHSSSNNNIKTQAGTGGGGGGTTGAGGGGGGTGTGTGGSNGGCSPYQALCGGVCVDLTTDPAHCGQCATACSATDQAPRTEWTAPYGLRLMM